MKYRYPGPKPFTEEDEALFFGRKNEKEQLNTIVQNNKLTVLFGRSGYGKSSLIQAAVVPHFKKSAKYKVIEIRFSYSSTKKEEISHLRKQLLDEFKKHIRQTIFLSEVENDKQGRSLWQLFTTIQWEAKQEGFNGILLIMDQFEEIFNFPKAQYDNLSIELADLVYNRIPPYFQETLMTKLDNADFSERNKEQVDFIKDALPTHFLIGIRSDRLYLLDELGEVIPVIFNNRYKLKQILIEQIEDIIEGPAKYKGDFLSVPFSYSPEVIKKISGFFENKEDMLSGQKTIEAFELQIICKYIEEKVILQVNGKKSSVDPDNIVVDNSYLPENLNDIIKNYYIDIVSGENEITKDLGEFERLIIRYLIEEKLIDNKTNSRICLDKVSITPMGFNEGLLDKLTETRIIRRELNTVTGQSYEISHDTLLQPIQDATRSTDLVELKHALNAYYHNILKKANQKSYLLRGHAIEKKFVDNHNNASYFTTNDFIHTQKNDTLIAELEKSKILNSSGEKPKKYILNEAFQDVVSSRVKNFDFSRLRAAMYALIISILVISFVVFLCVRVYNLYERERIQRVAERIVPEQDDYQKGKENLLVLNYVYKHLKDYPQRITTVPANLLKQFNYLYLFADTIAGHNDRDTISNFEVLPGDRIFAFFKNKNLNTGDQLQKGILYNKNLHVVDSFRKIYDAQALPGTNEMVILFKDSIRLYGAGLGVKLKNDSNSWIRFKPLSLIHKNLLFGIAQTSSTMGSQQYVLVNFNTGSIKLLSGNQNDQIYLKQDESGFIIASDPNIMSVDLDGRSSVVSRYSDYFSSTPLLRSANGTIRPLNMDRSQGYVDYSVSSVKQKTGNDTLKFLSFSNRTKEKAKIFSFTYPILVFNTFKDKFLITASLDSVRIFDNQLNLQKAVRMPKLKPGTSNQFNSISFNKDLSKFLLAASDSSLYLITANSIDKIHTPGIISSAQFSEDEKIIFCPDLPIPGKESTILILDRRLRSTGRISAVYPEVPVIGGNLIVLKRWGKLLFVNPEKSFFKFNNTIAPSVSDWITSKVGKAPDSLLKKSGVSRNMVKTLSSLLKHKF